MVHHVLHRPVGADWAGVPGREAPHDLHYYHHYYYYYYYYHYNLLLVTRRLGAAVDEGGDVAGHVEQHHVVA